MKIEILILLCVLLTGCLSNKHELNVPGESEIFGLATQVTLNYDTTKIILEDFFRDVSRIDSISHMSSVICHQSSVLSIDKKQVTVIASMKPETPLISELKIWIKGCAYSILLKKSGKLKIQMSFDAKGKKYKQVQLAGDFNNWNPKNTEMKNDNGIWNTGLLLNPGRYSYQIVADGKWMLDPSNKDSVDNNMGGFNSLLKAMPTGRQVGNSGSGSTLKLSTDKFKNNYIILSCNKSPDTLFVFWQNYMLPVSFLKKQGREIQIQVPENAKKIDRSFIRVWAYDKNGVSNDLLIPLTKGKVVSNSSELTRADLETQIIYFMLVDRFKNGNTKNDEPINDADVSPKANYMGGDLAGITQKIKEGYFSSLGVNTIWMTPIHQNPLKAYNESPPPHRKFSGYHGYWPTAITKIDYRFGTAEEFKTLVAEAHKNNMNVILDYVANHLHEESPLFKQHPGWATSMVLQDGRKNIRLWDECRLTTWFDTYLPTLDLARPDVYGPISDSAVYWVKTYNFDGFRHDATKHVPEIFWRVLTLKLKNQILNPQNKHFYQIGETYGSRELISSYVNSGELDGQFDFNLFFDARNIFAKDNESFEKLKNSLSESLAFYGYHHKMGNITGNHDQARFISLAGGGLKFNEDDKEAGWQRDVGIGNTVGYKKLSMLTAFVMTIPGIPVIYYGDEFGMPGANDPDNRRMMKFDNFSKEEKETKNIAEKLIKLRKNNLSLMYGDFLVLAVNDKYFAYSRSYFDDLSIIIFNKDSEPKTITLTLPKKFINSKFEAHFNSGLTISKDKIEVKLKGYGFEVLISD
ncbi:MAG: alpha-amylase [Bacteroidia bacterium]|nr:alpha-amylase [Bacteroidia bacterium]